MALFLLFLVVGCFQWFRMGSLLKNIQLILEFFQGSILGSTLFLLYINDLPDDVICNIAIYADTTPYSECDQTSDLWQQLGLASELKSNLQDTLDWGRKQLVDFNLEKFNWFCLTSLIKLVLLMWKSMGLFLSKKHLLKAGVDFLSKLDWGSHIISIAKTASKKIWALIHSMKFLSPEVALYP